ncbi:hypothetical protein HDU79_003144 [Rhizoclosmatium sp. JEL0117]|nr:hypothetical protein HDU79_003144 [Rhizoclosmatium sp. JEL0117]
MNNPEIEHSHDEHSHREQEESDFSSVNSDVWNEAAAAATGAELYECLTCNEVFPSPDGVQQHTIQGHRQEQPEQLTCYVCHTPATTEEELAHHAQIHPACDVCDSRFATPLDAQQHRTAEHVRQCNTCPAIFVSDTQLESHKKTHSTEDRPFACHLCHQRFKRQQELPQHMLYNHINKSEFKCKSCTETFSSQKDLRNHVLTHSKKSHVCPTCEKAFASQALLVSHGLVHTTEKPFKCEQCPAAFKRQEYLRQHGLVHSDEKPFVCSEPECTEKFKRHQQLKVHQLKHIRVAGAFKCKACFEAFDTRDDLHRHSSESHSLICANCHQTFKKLDLYNKHLSAQSCTPAPPPDATKPDPNTEPSTSSSSTTSTTTTTKKQSSRQSSKDLECDDCDLRFEAPETLKLHASKHSVFHCKQCGKEFPNFEARDYHKRLHKQEKCEVCGKVYGTTSRLLAHVRSKHGGVAGRSGSVGVVSNAGEETVGGNDGGSGSGSGIGSGGGSGPM